MEREIYERLSTKLDYETFIKCYCPECEKENCIHRGAYRRTCKSGRFRFVPKFADK